jgi:hypothetical protein
MDARSKGWKLNMLVLVLSEMSDLSETELALLEKNVLVEISDLCGVLQCLAESELERRVSGTSKFIREEYRWN